MGRIFAMHGIVAAREQSFCHRNLMDAGRFRRVLEGRSEPFCSIAKALRSEGHALTVDDATWAGVAAARLARSMGHELTMYVNPEPILSGRPYPLCRVNAYLDAFSGQSVELDGVVYSLSDHTTLRGRLKRILGLIPTTNAQHEWLDEFAEEKGVSDAFFPHYLAPPPLGVLVELHGEGICIGNHGWSHVDYDQLRPAQCLREVETASAWLNEHVGPTTGSFAVPYGEAVPPTRLQNRIDLVWLLLDNRLNEGFLGSRVFNRSSLHVAHPEVTQYASVDHA